MDHIQASGGRVITEKKWGQDAGTIQEARVPSDERYFGFNRIRYRGLAEIANRMLACFALVNLYITRKRLVPPGA
jgi:hypothetical protein